MSIRHKQVLSLSMFERDYAVRHRKGAFDISRLSQGFIVIQKQVSIFAPVKIAGLDNRPFKPGLRDPPHRRGPDAGKRYHPTAAGHQKSCAEEGGTKEGSLQHSAQPPIQTSNAPHAR
jgi:hypothetical protein